MLSDDVTAFMQYVTLMLSDDVTASMQYVTVIHHGDEQ